ncbi:MAG: hypothetical protein KIT83_17880 [Bryobacterales bacterium]|nr:hypothetical protein [Bryobacterales bacterium]
MYNNVHEGRRVRQIIVLIRHFRDRLQRDFFGVGEGDASSGVTTMLALLFAYSVCVAAFLVLAYGFQLFREGQEERLIALLSARDFLTASTIALTGAYFVFLWENLFPDRRDCHVLLAQPVSRLIVLAAKLLASLAFLGGFLIVLNSCTAVVLPFVSLLSGGQSLVAELSAHLLAQSVTSLFVFFGLSLVMATLLLVLPFRMFQWAKPVMQFMIFALLLGQMFFSPPIALLKTPAVLPLAEFARMWPSFWFIGLADSLTQGAIPHGEELALMALAATLLAVVAGIIAIVLAYPKAVRYAVEMTDFAQRRSTRFSIAEIWLSPWLSDNPPALAIGLYTLRVLLRDARSRAMFLLCAGIAVGYGLREVAAALHSSSVLEVTQPMVNLLPLPLVLTVFLLIAIRSLCATPISLSASWIFRLLDSGEVRRVRIALRGVLLAVVIFPISTVCLIFHTFTWNSWIACTHTVFVLALSLVAMEWTLRKLDFIPFTRPKSEQLGRLRVMFGIYAIFFVFFTFVIAHLEDLLLRRVDLFIPFLIVSVGAWLAIFSSNNRKNGMRVVTSSELSPILITLELDS